MGRKGKQAKEHQDARYSCLDYHTNPLNTRLEQSPQNYLESYTPHIPRPDIHQWQERHHRLRSCTF